MLRTLRVNAVELMRQPGAVKPVSVVLDAAGRQALELGDERIVGDVVFEGEAVSSIDGISVQGAVEVPWHGECRRCLTAVDGVAHARFDEMFQPAEQVADADAIPFEGDQIDLAPVLREYVLLELPGAPLCRPDCPGIYPGYEGDSDGKDPRWAALDQLKRLVVEPVESPPDD